MVVTRRERQEPRGLRGIDLRCLVALAVGALAVGCRGESGEVAEFDHRELNPVELKLSLFLEDTALGTPWRVHVLNDTVMLVTDNQQPFLHTVHLRERRILTSFGRSGRGPGEFVSVPQIAAFRTPTDSFVTWARDLSRFTLASSRRRPGRPDSTVSIQRHGATTNPIVVGDSALVLQSTTDSTGMVFIGLRDGDARYFSSPMKFERSDSLTPLAASTLPGDIVACGSLDGRSVVRASRVAGRVELIDVRSGEVKPVTVPFSFEPYYQWDPEYSGYVVQQVSKQRRAYVDCAVTQTGFVLLFSGRLRGAFQDHYERLLGRFIHAFDWEGNLKYIARTDVPVWALASSLDGESVYAIRWEPGPAIMKGTLPPMPR